MVTGRQIEAYALRRFPGMIAQPSVHGAGRGSVQLFDAAWRLVADLNVPHDGHRFRATLREVGDMLAEARRNA